MAREGYSRNRKTLRHGLGSMAAWAFFLIAAGSGSSPVGAQGHIFSDDFEQGNTAAWAQTFWGVSVTITGPDSPYSTSSTVDVSGITTPFTTVRVNGIDAEVFAGQFVAYDVPLKPGPNLLIAEAVNDQSDTASFSTAIEFDPTDPVVSIDAPMDDLATMDSSIQLSGTVSEPSTVRIGETIADLNGLDWTAEVDLREGSNILVAAATDVAGRTGVDSIRVLRDTTPPRVAILSPTPDTVIPNPDGTLRTTVTGTVNDIIAGAVNLGECSVEVNGVPAEVANGGWVAYDVPVAVGPGTLVAVAVDRTGQRADAMVEVIGSPPNTAHVAAISGNAQEADIETVLKQPLVVEVRDDLGTPVAGVAVLFQISRGDGSLVIGKGSESRSAEILSGIDGRATVGLRLGTRTGKGTDRVEASAEGFSGTAIFSSDASLSADAERRIVAAGGRNQIAVTGSPVPHPLTVLVTDVYSNPVEGADVTFTVVDGDGAVSGGGSYTVATDDDGHAFTPFTLGSIVGPGSHIVEASVVNGNLPVRFVATAVEAGNPEDTAVSGVVLDNQKVPISGVEIILDGTGRSTLTGEDGGFLLTDVPPGHGHLTVDGSTAGDYPQLGFEIELIAGIDNAQPRAIALPKIDDFGKATASDTQDAVISRPDLPGLRLSIPAGSATFADGSKTGEVQIVTVNNQAVPMAPTDGTFPRAPISIQPANVKFEPAVPLRLPNLEGHPPGKVVTLYSFDHDVFQFVRVSTLKVSEDGRFLESEPGQGVVHGGWHYVPPVLPVTTTLGQATFTLRCVHDNGGATCKRFRLIANICQMQTHPLQGGTPPDTPDATCLKSNQAACQLANLWQGGPGPGFDARDFFNTSGQACQRGWEATIPFPGLAAPITGRCCVPTVNNQWDLPVCCPVGHWDGTGCRAGFVGLPEPPC